MYHLLTKSYTNYKTDSLFFYTYAKLSYANLLLAVDVQK